MKMMQIRRSCCALLTIAAMFASVARLRAAQQGDLPTAVGGYCAVCLAKGGKWVAGKLEHQAQFDGRVYLFPSAKERDVFAASPTEFVPALQGDCIVCYAKQGARVPGKIEHSVRHRGRIYLFPSDQEKQMFLKAPLDFENADLAYGGHCAVCAVKAGKDVPGKPEFMVVHDGLRYLFPSAKERDVFLADPARFIQDSSRERRTSSIGVDKQLISISGKSGCAACTYGVRPLGSPESLGLAVETADGNVFVVEDAEKSYPKIFDDRFDGITLQVSGRPIKSSGKFVWLAPTSVSVVE